MPIFSALKPELKEEMTNIINLAKQKNINNEELTAKCKKFFESVFSDNNKSCIKECCEQFFNYLKEKAPSS